MGERRLFNYTVCELAKTIYLNQFMAEPSYVFICHIFCLFGRKTITREYIVYLGVTDQRNTAYVIRDTGALLILKLSFIPI